MNSDAVKLVPVVRRWQAGGVFFRPGNHLVAQHVGGGGGQFVLPPVLKDSPLRGKTDDSVAVIHPLDELHVLVAVNQSGFNGTGAIDAAGLGAGARAT